MNIEDVCRIKEPKWPDELYYFLGLMIMLLIGTVFGALLGRGAAEDQWEASRRQLTVPDRFISADNDVRRGRADSHWQPPAALQKGILVAVEFGPKEMIHQDCDDDPKEYDAVACEWEDGHHGPVLALPNPCGDPTDDYALTVCHELGHANGWPSDHAGGHFVQEIHWNQRAPFVGPHTNIPCPKMIICFHGPGELGIPGRIIRHPDGTCEVDGFNGDIVQAYRLCGVNIDYPKGKK